MSLSWMKSAGALRRRAVTSLCRGRLISLSSRSSCSLAKLAENTVTSPSHHHRNWSNAAVAVQLDDFSGDDNDHHENSHRHTHDPKHCHTCTCPEEEKQPLHHFENPLLMYPDNTSPELDHDKDDYPPPLPEPKVTFRRRVLPDHLVALSTLAGQEALVRALTQQTAATYCSLTQHWDNQSDPASCGVTTLRQVLNAAGMDPTAVRW